MLKEISILVFALACCYADTPVPSQGVLCGRVPEHLYRCIGSPKVVSPDVIKSCATTGTPCSKMTCLVTESGWLTAGTVDKKKVAEYFDTYAASHPAWSAAVSHLKAACLGDRPLPAQGVDVNCPAYDIIHCSLISFMKNTAASQWLPGAECDRARVFASACPICPNECFEKQVPNDSCHACFSLPRSA